MITATLPFCPRTMTRQEELSGEPSAGTDVLSEEVPFQRGKQNELDKSSKFIKTSFHFVIGWFYTSLYLFICQSFVSFHCQLIWVLETSFFLFLFLLPSFLSASILLSFVSLLAHDLSVSAELLPMTEILLFEVLWFWSSPEWTQNIAALMMFGKTEIKRVFPFWCKGPIAFTS